MAPCETGALEEHRLIPEAKCEQIFTGGNYMDNLRDELATLVVIFIEFDSLYRIRFLFIEFDFYF